MNIEIEVKAKVKNIASIKKRLKAIGAKHFLRVHQIDTYYLISPKYRFRAGFPRLRIREDVTKKKFSWDYHEPIDIFGAREFEVAINDPKTAKVILDKLGYEREAVIDKVRDKYKMGNLNIDIDQVKGLGNYIEAEVMNSSRQASLNQIYQFFEQLGIHKDDLMPEKRYLDMTWEKAGKKARPSSK